MNQFTQDCRKLEKVIESCKTKDQMRSAFAYFKLWEKKHDPELIPRTAYIRWASTNGYCTGYFMGWLNQRKQ